MGIFTSGCDVGGSVAVRITLGITGHERETMSTEEGNMSAPVDAVVMRPMTVRDLIAKLQALPGDLELWRNADFYAAHDRTGIREVPIFFNSWPDEKPHWEFTEATPPGRCIRMKRVAMLIDNDGDVLDG